MAPINVNQPARVRMVRIEGCFHKLPLYFITRKVLENRGFIRARRTRFMYYGKYLIDERKGNIIFDRLH
jgi:hypothetical protein